MNKICQSIVALIAIGFSLPALAMSPQLLEISERWAEIKYQTPKEQRVDALEKLQTRAETLAQAHPGEAGPLIWQAIILSTTAGEQGGLGALSLVKRAKKLLERAASIDADALEGSVYTSLGSLYYQVPGWPIGFGSDKKAREYLQKALAVNPDGMDPNYFYGDFLLREENDYAGAAAAFEHALAAPARERRPIADAGRRGEIEAALAKAREGMK